jgi:hypothetical protein
MRRSASIAALVMILAPLANGAEDERFTPLFNSRDLSGWVPVNVAPNTFTVRDNMIVCNGVPTGVMRTDRQYENFVLELEWMHLVPGGNAGLFVWSEPVTSPGVPFTKSIEVQILDGSNSENHTSHGDVFSIHGATMKPDRPHPRGAMRCLPSERRANPAGQWNHYRVVCNDGVLKLSVNGKEVSGGTNCQPRKGYICLESEGGTVHYRNIRIKELPSTNPKPDQVAPLDEGFKSMYTGIDLTGWREEPGHKGHWQPKDWVLSYDGNSEAQDKNLWTAKEYGDFVMIADWRMKGEAGDSGILLRGSDKAEVNIGPGGGNEPGKWNRLVVTMKGQALTVVLNGRTVRDKAPISGIPSRGRIGLQHGGHPIEFANLYIKEVN